MFRTLIYFTHQILGPSKHILYPRVITFVGYYGDVEAHPGLLRILTVQHPGLFAVLPIDVNKITGVGHRKTEVPGNPLVHIHLAAVADLVRTFAITAVVVAALGALGTWWTVRRELKPVDQMVETASAIAGGDLSKRVDVVHSSVELGRLGTALNDMLVQIEDAITQEQHAKARLTDFVADASHELRTPIAAVLGYSELYRQGALVESKDIDNAMRRIGTETSRMERLVDDLLLLARLDRVYALEPSSVNLSDVIGDAVTNSEAIDPDHPITVNSTEVVRVMGDEQRLTQVIANLLSNARAHTPSGTAVTISLREEDDRAIIDIVDDGPGLPEDNSEKLFERFYRVDSSRSRETGGAGLGLAIVAAIVAAHEGTIEAGNLEGHGARVTINLPTGMT